MLFKSLLLISFLALNANTHAEDSSSQVGRVTALSSSIWMRGLASALKEVCSGAKQDCFQTNYTIDPYTNDQSAAEAVKIGFVKDNDLKTKLVSLDRSHLFSALKKVFERAEIQKTENSSAHMAAVLTQLKSLSKDYQITAFEALSFSAVSYHQYVIILIRNEKFDLGEAIAIGAGPTENF